METELKNNNINIDFYVIIYLLEIILLLLLIFNRGNKKTIIRFFLYNLCKFNLLILFKNFYFSIKNE